MSNNILIIVAHPDDETFGMGGTIARHKFIGDKVFVISMTNGIGARNNHKLKDIEERKKSSQQASEILEFEWLCQYELPDNQLDAISFLKIVKLIEDAKDIVKPKFVYTHHFGDLNIDHQIVCKATLTSFRPESDEICKVIRTFEIPSSTDYSHPTVSNFFSPNMYVNINKFWEKKLLAIKAYENELKPYPNIRSVEGLSGYTKFRGLSVGLERAEAFQTLREIWS